MSPEAGATGFILAFVTTAFYRQVVDIMLIKRLAPKRIKIP
jgi:hypothetical protein